MCELFLMLAAGLAALWGFALLALSQQRHFVRVFGTNSHPALSTWAQRATGFIAIGLSLPACIAAEGSGFGSLLGVLLICAAAMTIALTLTWRPHWLRRLLCLCIHDLTPPPVAAPTSSRFF